jgi:hypothetical protein
MFELCEATDVELLLGLIDRMHSDRCRAVGCVAESEKRSGKEELCTGHLIEFQARTIAALKDDLKLAMQMIDEHCPYAVE